MRWAIRFIHLGYQVNFFWQISEIWCTEVNFIPDHKYLAISVLFQILYVFVDSVKRLQRGQIKHNESSLRILWTIGNFYFEFCAFNLEGLICVKTLN